MIIVSGGARYGCPQHFDRRICKNGLTIRHEDLERVLLDQLQQAVLTPEVVDYVVEQLSKAQNQQRARLENENELREIGSKLDRIVAAIEAAGHSEAILKDLKLLEDRKREISAKTADGRQLTEQQIREHVAGALGNVTALLAKSPPLAKAKLSEHVDSIRLIPQPDGAYIAEGKWDLLGTGVQ